MEISKTGSTKSYDWGTVSSGLWVDRGVWPQLCPSGLRKQHWQLLSWAFNRQIRCQHPSGPTPKMLGGQVRSLTANTQSMVCPVSWAKCTLPSSYKKLLLTRTGFEVKNKTKTTMFFILHELLLCVGRWGLSLVFRAGSNTFIFEN